MTRPCACVLGDLDFDLREVTIDRQRTAVTVLAVLGITRTLQSRPLHRLKRAAREYGAASATDRFAAWGAPEQRCGAARSGFRSGRLADYAGLAAASNCW